MSSMIYHQVTHLISWWIPHLEKIIHSFIWRSVIPLPKILALAQNWNRKYRSIFYALESKTSNMQERIDFGLEKLVYY